MERFVFFAAIVFAVVYGIGAMSGEHIHMGFDYEEDGGGASPVLAAEPGRFETQTFQGEELQLRHLAALVTITPEDRADFSVTIDNPGGAPMPAVSAEGGAVIVDGQLRGRIRDCRSDSVELRGYGDISTENLPRVEIRAPRELVVRRGGAGSTAIGAANTLDFDLSGCGQATVADIAEMLSLDVSGPGVVRAGSARHLKAEVAGSGEIFVGAVSERADIEVAGSGEVTLGSLNGNLASQSAGSGEVAVEGGAIGTAEIEVAGSGGVRIAAAVQTLDVDIAGSGDVEVEGQVGDITADIVGSGSVSAQAVTGNVRKDVLGSGDVHVGR